MPVLPNPRAERFCLEYVRCGDAALAVVKSGLGVPSDPADGKAALAVPAIQARIEELRAPLEDAILSVLARKVKLSAIADHEPMPEAINARDRISAIAELNKMGGDYAPEKHQIAQHVTFEVVYRDAPVLSQGAVGGLLPAGVDQLGTP